MNTTRKIATILLVTGLMTAFTQAATKTPATNKDVPDATLKLSGGAVAAGIGFSWGGGTLTYKGKDYPVKVSGVSLGKVGITGSSATGEIYGLKRLADFDGHYNAWTAGLTLAGGRASAAMKNQNNVRVFLKTTSKGVDVTLAANGVDMRIKK
ncbi:MAG: hypothetical protein ACJ8HQ_05535 [Chthoniobacterales bacterium]